MPAGTGSAEAAELGARAAQLAAEGRVDEALPLQRRLVELSPQDAEAWAGLGALLTAAREPETAIEALQQAIVLDPNVADYHVLLGDAYAALDDGASARAAYRRALVLDPHHADARQGLADLARAQAASQPPPSRDLGDTGTVSYRLELALAYVGAPFVGAGLGAAAPPLGVFALFVPATVHWIFGEAARGVIALLAWPASAILGGLAGAALQGECHGEFCGLEGFLVGGLIGAVVWPIIDVATAPRVARGPTTGRAPTRPRLSAAAGPLPGGGAIALSASF